MTSTPGDPGDRREGNHQPPPIGSYESAPLDYPADYPDQPMFAGPPVPPGVPPPSFGVPPMPPGYYPPPPGYPPYPPPYDPYAGYRAGVPPGQNGPSVAALVCALLGVPMCMCFLPSLAAILLGIIGIQQTGRTGQAGRGMAIAGLAIGLVTLLLGFLFMAGGGVTSVFR